MSTQNTLSEDEIIAQAKEAFGDVENDERFDSLLQSLEAFYMNGSADEQSGDADTFGHFYRVHRWIVWTDSQGFHEIETHDTEKQAIRAFGKHNREYDQACNDPADQAWDY